MATPTTAPRRPLRMQASPRHIREQYARITPAPIPARPAPLPIPPLSAFCRYILVRLEHDPPDDPAFARDLARAYYQERARAFGIHEERL